MKRWFWVMLVLCMAGLAWAQDGGEYISPDGLWKVNLPQGWLTEETPDYVLIKSPDDGILIYSAVFETDDLLQATMDTWAIVDPDFDRENYLARNVQYVEDAVLLQGFERALSIVYADGTGAGGAFIAAGASLYQGKSYTSVIITNIAELQRRFAQFQAVSSSFKATAMDADEVLTDVEPLAWNDAIADNVRAFVNEAMAGLDVQGASVAVVQDGQVVFAEGFGVTGEGGTPVDADTLMMIGSTTKSMSTLLMAQAVDAGAMAWDTPVTDVLPAFAVKDPAITEQLIVEHLVCACTGVPRRDFEMLFNTASVDDVFATLREFEFFTDFGETFQYSNQMVAAGGYAATAALAGTTDDLYGNYARLMQERVFAPLGMSRSFVDVNDVLNLDNVALPHASNLLGYQAMTLEEDGVWVRPVAPAGAVWSTANDMAKYALFQLARGVNADGVRVVSEENLRHTWQPQVTIDANTSYGLGWIVASYKGIEMITHGGNTFGFSSEFSFMPDKGLGIVVLTNQRASALNGLLNAFILEELFQVEKREARDVLTFVINSRAEALAKEAEAQTLSATLTDVASLAPYAGTYSNAALGEAVVTIADDGTASVDFGEFAMPLWQRTGEDGVSYVFYSDPLTGAVLTFGEADGTRTFKMGEGLLEYVFTQQ